MEPGKIRPVDYQSNAAQVGMLQNMALRGKSTDAKEVQQKKGAQGAAQTGDLGGAGKEVQGEEHQEPEAEQLYLPASTQESEFSDMESLRQMSKGIGHQLALPAHTGDDENALVVYDGGKETSHTESERSHSGIGEPPTISIDGGLPVELKPVGANFDRNDPNIIDAEFVELDDKGKPIETGGAGSAGAAHETSSSSASGGTGTAHETSSGETKTATPPPLPPTDSQKWTEYQTMTKENKQLLDDVYRGRIALQNVPDLPLGEAESRLQKLVDFTSKDSKENKEVPFWKKFGFWGDRKALDNYDRMARVATEQQAAQNPGVDKKKLHLYNLSQIILNDKDAHTGKPRMENLAASAFQYARAYEGAAMKQTEKGNPAMRIGKEIDSMMAGLNPEAKEAVLGKERELYDAAMLMAAKGQQMSQEDVQMQRASNLVELGRQGKIPPELAEKARDYLMHSQAMGPESQGAFTGQMPGGSPDYTMYNAGPNMPPIPGIPNQPGMGGAQSMSPPGMQGMQFDSHGLPIPPGMGYQGMPNQGMPGAQGFVPPQQQYPGQFPQGPQGPIGQNQGDYSSFVNMLMMQEKASRLNSTMMMMMVGGPTMLPYALMMNLMPSSIPNMASVFNPNAVPMPQPYLNPNWQNQNQAGQGPSFSNANYAAPSPSARKPLFLYEEKDPEEAKKAEKKDKEAKAKAAREAEEAEAEAEAQAQQGGQS
jgi:hypothetical protein